MYTLPNACVPQGVLDLHICRLLFWHSSCSPSSWTRCIELPRGSHCEVAPYSPLDGKPWNPNENRAGLPAHCIFGAFLACFGCCVCSGALRLEHPVPLARPQVLRLAITVGNSKGSSRRPQMWGQCIVPGIWNNYFVEPSWQSWSSCDLGSLGPQARLSAILPILQSWSFAPLARRLVYLFRPRLTTP